MKNNFDLSSSNWGTIKNTKFDIVILPWGAIEPHNYHLPYFTDCYIAQTIALKSAEKAFNKSNVRCMVMPPIYLGSQNPGQWSLPFCIHTNSDTHRAILSDIVSSFHVQGFRKLVIINGHGGNTFKPIIRDLAKQYPDFFIVVSDWWTTVKPEHFFEEKVDDHAGETETSVMMHFYPELVELENAGNGMPKSIGFDSIEKDKIAWMPRHWQKVTDDTGIGNPTKSSAEKGKRCADEISNRIADLLIEFANIEI